MANELHLSIIKQGVEAWNKWRSENPEIEQPDLSWAELNDQNLMWANFKGCDLSWAKLNNCNLIWADFTAADLSRANLSRSDFTTSVLDGAVLHNANLTSAYFYRASLVNADLQETDAEKAVFSSSNLSGVSFRNAILKGAKFQNVNLQYTEFNDADLESASFDESEETTSKVDPEVADKTGYRWIKLAAPLATLAVAATLIYLWFNLRSNVEIAIAKSAMPTVIFDNTRLSPTRENETDYFYELDGLLPGNYPMFVYATQLNDINTHEFVRFKRFSDTLNIGTNERHQSIRVDFDTLYSVRKIAEGIAPNISPDGQKIIFLKKKPKSAGIFESSMWLCDVPTEQSTQIKLHNTTLYDWDWDWDRPFLRGNGQHIFLSAFNHRKRQSFAFMIDSTTGEVTDIPINLQRNWLKYLPLANSDKMIIENKLYSMEGEYLRTYNFQSMYQKEVFYGGNNGFVVLNEEDTDQANSVLLECTYVNHETLEAKVLFEIPKGRAPFISAANEAQRVVLTQYNGITNEFTSVIQLWSDGVMVNLTNDFRDGQRKYANGSTYHKTEACADDAGQNIVYEYEGNIYLLQLPESVTIEALALANMPEALISSTESLHQNKM